MAPFSPSLLSAFNFIYNLDVVDLGGRCGQARLPSGRVSVLPSFISTTVFTESDSAFWHLTTSAAGLREGVCLLALWRQYTVPKSTHTVPRYVWVSEQPGCVCMCAVMSVCVRGSFGTWLWRVGVAPLGVGSIYTLLSAPWTCSRPLALTGSATRCLWFSETLATVVIEVSSFRTFGVCDGPSPFSMAECYNVSVHRGSRKKAVGLIG